MEYSIAAAALFNPSICLDVDQDGLKDGECRVIMSLRAVGEGHISSILFRSAVVGADGSVDVDPPYSPLSTGTVEGDPDCGSYHVEFASDVPLAGRVIFPRAADELAGLEDVRLVRFEEDGGTDARYYATVTGYDGKTAIPKMLETTDFRRFRIFTLTGNGAENKDMGLFPRRIGGRYAMISRQDGQRVFVMFSDRIDTWNETTLVREPTFAWEFMQIGGCGSPIETDEGWLLPMHGVGPFRRYAIGFYLLDRDDPTRLLAVTPEPLIEPQDNERDGYVPNVVYSCGAVVHDSRLIMPFAINDTAIRFATGATADIMKQLKPV